MLLAASLHYLEGGRVIRIVAQFDSPRDLSVSSANPLALRFRAASPPYDASLLIRGHVLNLSPMPVGKLFCQNYGRAVLTWTHCTAARLFHHCFQQIVFDQEAQLVRSAAIDTTAAISRRVQPRKHFLAESVSSLPEWCI